MGGRRIALTGATVAAIAAAACSSDSPPASPPPSAVLDAGVAMPIDAGAAVIPDIDPTAGYHLDDAGGSTPRRGDRVATRDRRTLQLMLVSTPSNAIAAVDGKVIGRTPTYWEGEFTGRDREFTFVLPNYSMARYRFVPIQNGHVHGRLHKIITDGDAGVPAIPVPAEASTPPAPSATASKSPRRAPPTTPPVDAAPPPSPPALPIDAALPPTPPPPIDAGS